MAMKAMACDLHSAYGLSDSAGPTRAAIQDPMKLLIGLRYRVAGILHEYLGPARMPQGSGIAHVFLRNEWRPDTPGQFPLTLVEESDVEDTVTSTKMRGRRR